MVVRVENKAQACQSITEEHYQSTRGAQVSSIYPTIDGSKIDEEDCCVSVCVCVLMQQSMPSLELHVDYSECNVIVFVSCALQFVNIGRQYQKNNTCEIRYECVNVYLRICSKRCMHKCSVV